VDISSYPHEFLGLRQLMIKVDKGSAAHIYMKASDGATIGLYFTRLYHGLPQSWIKSSLPICIFDVVLGY
jgi:hypothetical protein